MHKTDNREETETHKCPDCDKIGIRDGDEMVCPDCGMVVGDAALSLEGRIGRPHQLGSVIDGAGPEDWQSVDNIKRYKKLKGIQEKVVKDPKEAEIEKLERRLEEHEDYLRTIEPKIYRIATLKYVDAYRANCVRGRSVEYVFGACLYQAYLSKGDHWSLSRITKGLRIGRGLITHLHKFLSGKLKWRRDTLIKNKYDEVKEDIVSIISTLGYSNLGIQKSALSLAEKDMQLIQEGAANPRGIAAAYIYAAGAIVGPELTYLVIADAAEVTERTVKNQYHSLAEGHVKAATNPPPSSE